MRIAIASGKGGTGKTMVATNLTWTAARGGDKTAYIDCDVEEPNGHIFLKPDIENVREGTMAFPVVNMDTCTGCGACAELCRYKAIILLSEKPLVFPEMCHACGGCMLVCPVDAITYSDRGIGAIETGTAFGAQFIQGRLDVGQVLSPPLIRQVKKLIPDDGLTILDSPPGTSCPVIETVHGADYAVLVTEPTPFGLNDMKLAVEMLNVLRIPFGVFINRADIGTRDTVKFCEKHALPVLASLPDDRRIAEAYSNGMLAAEMFPDIREMFISFYAVLKEKVRA